MTSQFTFGEWSQNITKFVPEWRFIVAGCALFKLCRPDLELENQTKQTKSKLTKAAPSPSVVPAAKEYPSAAIQV